LILCKKLLTKSGKLSETPLSLPLVQLESVGVCMHSSGGGGSHTGAQHPPIAVTLELSVVQVEPAQLSASAPGMLLELE
jgi:hypothetical protein